MGKITTVLFDFDGTIMNTNDVIIKSWQHTFRALTGKEQEESAIVKTFGEPLELTMGRFFGGEQEEVNKNIEIYRSFHRDNFGKLITVFPGIHDLLAELKDRENKLGLVTSRLKRTTMEGLEKYKLDRYFDYVVTADDTTVHKPDPAPILIALNNLGSTHDEAIMVGDTWMDMKCAANANVPAVLVDWSIAFTGAEREGEHKPDYIIKEAMDLVALLDRI